MTTGRRSVDEWIGSSPDAAIPPRVKERVAARAGDRCQHCQREIVGKLRAEFDHVIPLILGGKHAETNLQLLCNECHAGKTALDLKLKSKVASIRKRRLGLVPKKPQSPYKRKLNGQVVHRDTGLPVRRSS